MQMKVLLACLLISAAGAARLTRSNETPVDKVVKLIEELKSNVEADSKSEQASYDKFACWCEDTLGEKATAISDAKETIEKTQAKIVKLKSEIASHQVEIKQLEKDIAANMESTREATEMREKESEEYESEKAESEQCIGALEAAINVLQGAGTGSGKSFLGTLQEAQLLGVVAGVKNVLNRPRVEKTMAEKDMEVVRRFVDRPEDFVSGRTGVLTAVQIANNPFGDYAPQSTQIQGILKSMYDSFTSDLEKANAEEAGKQKGFEDLMVTKKAELATLQSSLQQHTGDEAQKSKDLADSKTLLDDTKEQLEADEEFFVETKTTCKTKSQDWASRTRLRTEELAGMTQAIAILTSDKAQETFASATSFLQVARASAEPERASAYMQIRKLATKYQSLSLARLAAAVKTGGHFDKVITEIDKMIALLRKEEQDDIKQRDLCERDGNKNKNTMEDLDYDIKKAESALKRMEDEAKDLQDKIDAIEKDITATNTSLADLKKMREDEKDEFVQSVKDDTEAVALLEEAIAALAKFYERNKKSASFAQKKRADPMPDTNFQDGDYGGRKGESKGILAILGMIKEDLEKEIKVSREEDAADQITYEKDRNALIDTMRAQKKSKLATEKELAQLNQKIADVEEFKGQKETDLEGETEMKNSLATNCAWVKENFKSRATKRKTEISGLIDAKNFLAGVEST